MSTIEVYGFTISEAKSHYIEDVNKYISNCGLQAETKKFSGNTMYSIIFYSSADKARFIKEFESTFPFLLK